MLSNLLSLNYQPMKNRNTYLLFLLWGMLCACTDSSFIKQGNVLNLEMAMHTKKQITLSNLYDSLECIPLETNDSSLLGNRAYLSYADEQNLFIMSNDVLYRFNSNGDFLNKIGRRGNAPGEYNRAYSISADKERKCFLYYIGQNKIQFWGYNGEFIKEIRLQEEGELTAVNILGQGQIIAENRTYSDNGLKIDIDIFNREGELLKKIPISEDQQTVSRSMHTIPLLYPARNTVKYKDINSDVLYSFSKNSYEQEWLFNLGNYAPSRDVLENVALKEALMRDFAQLVDIKETKKQFYFLIVHDNALRGIIVNKETGHLEYSQVIDIPQMGGGLKNDYIDKSCFWPSFVSDSDEMYCLLPVEKLTTKGRQDVERHTSSTVKLLEDSNPVVIKVYASSK